MIIFDYSYMIKLLSNSAKYIEIYWIW